MRVPAHDDVESGHGGIEIQLVDIMEHIEENWAGFGDRSRRQGLRPGSLIDIAADGDHRGHGFKGGNDFGLADIAGMNDQIRSLECAQGFLAEHTMRVGD